MSLAYWSRRPLWHLRDLWVGSPLSLHNLPISTSSSQDSLDDLLDERDLVEPFSTLAFRESIVLN